MDVPKSLSEPRNATELHLVDNVKGKRSGVIYTSIFSLFHNYPSHPILFCGCGPRTARVYCRTCTHDLEEATECPLMQFAGDTKLEGRQLMSLRAGLPSREPCRNGLKGTS